MTRQAGKRVIGWAWLRLALAPAVLAALTAPALAQSREPNNVDTIIGLTILIAAGLVYILPSIIAFIRGHPNRWVILLVNLFFGATLLGWIAAMVWALNAVHRSATGSHGGESGLNIYANDVQTLRVVHEDGAQGARSAMVAAQRPSNEDHIAHLERLKGLRNRGVISQEEHERMRLAVLERMIE